MNVKIAIGLALALVALCGALRFLPGNAEVPDLTLQTVDGRSFQLGQLRGKPLLVTFWATTCSICVKEIPHWAKLYRDLHPQGLEMIAIAMAYDPPSHVLQMVNQRQIPYPVALDPLSAAAQAFGDVSLTPAAFLISPQGLIVQRRVGVWDTEQLRGLIQTML